MAAFGSDDDDYDDESNDSSNFYTEDEHEGRATISDVDDLSPVSSTPSIGLVNETDTDRFNIHLPNILQGYKNFDKKQDSFHVIAKFNWEDYAISVLNKYAPETANCLSQQTEFAFEMTNNMYGTKQVKSTLRIRNAVNKYLMSIHGIVDKFFNYERMNEFLPREIKALSKKIMCDPLSVTLEDYQEATSLTPEERCHICIIVMETKRRVELLYLTKVLSQFIGL